MKNQLICDIQTKQIEINQIEPKLNELLLIRYKEIKKNNIKATAKVKNNVCTGCNMEIPRYLIESLKKEEISYCESCGKILCKQDDLS